MMHCELANAMLCPPLHSLQQDKTAPSPEKGEKGGSVSRMLMSVEQDSDREFYIPSVDLLTAQVEHTHAHTHTLLNC